MPDLSNIHHIAICTTPDLYNACKQFYTGILGLTIVREVYREERQSYKLDLALNGKYCIELFSFPELKERASYPEAKGLRHLAFAVHDLNAWYEQLQAAAIRVEPIRKDELTGQDFLFFYDPAGQPLELYTV
ncbi:MAG TPA: VOC family protein [Sediminibacterium sp.]|nr:VOC family protein [Sediminibacterium sp.]